MKMPGMYPPSCRFDEERSRSLRSAHPLGPFVAMRDPEVLLMLEPLAGRAIGCPVLLVLLELLEPLEHDDQRAATAHQPYRRLGSRRHRDRGGDDDMPDLEQLEPALAIWSSSRACAGEPCRRNSSSTPPSGALSTASASCT